MSVTNGGNPLLRNGRGTIIIGAAGISSLLGGLAFVANLYLAPIRDAILRQEVETARLAAELARIANLAAERGRELPNIRADVSRIEAEQTRLRDRIDRMERANRK